MKNQVYNPYLPNWEYIPDGEPRVFNDRLYIFGSHDRFNGADYCENDYVSWSAPVDDLSDWRYEGVILRKNQTPWNIKMNNILPPMWFREVMEDTIYIILWPTVARFQWQFVTNLQESMSI